MTPVLLVTLVLFVPAVFGWLPPTLEALFGSAAAFLLPGTAILALAGVREGSTREWLLGPTLAPVVLGGVYIAASFGGLAPRPLLAGVVIASGVILLLLRLREGRAAAVSPVEEDDTSLGWLPWAVGLAIAGVVAIILVSSPWRRITSDAWFHIAVVDEMARGGLPPHDPYFSGLTLQYFWFFHAVLAALREITGLAPAASMALLNIVAAALCAPAAARVVRALGFSRPAGAWAGVMFLLGMGGLFWLFYPVKLASALTGDVQGREALGYLFRLEWTPESTSRFTQIFLSSGFMLRKFLVGTAASWGLLMVLTSAGAALRFVTRGERSQAALYFLNVLGAFLFHVVIGGASLAGLALGAGGAWLLGFGARRRLFMVGVLTAAAMAACLPYLAGVAGTKESDNLFPIGLHPLALASLPFTIAGVLALSLPMWKGLWRARRSAGPAGLFLGWALASAGYGILGRLPGPNQFDKPPLIIFVPLALLAGAAVPTLWRRWESRPRLRTLFAAFLFLFLIPENALQWGGFFGSRTAPEMPAAERALYDWIGEETPRDAIFIDSGDRSEVLVRGPRRQYWGIEAYAYQWGYPRDEMDKRRGIRDMLYAGGYIDPQKLLPLWLETDGPIYVIVRDEDAPRAAAKLRARIDLFEQVFQEPGIRVFKLADRHPEAQGL